MLRGFYYMVACTCEISLFVLKIFHSFAALKREVFFSTLEEKFLVSSWPCNILYLLGVYEAQLDNLVLKYINMELRRRFPCAKGKGKVGFRQLSKKRANETSRAEKKWGREAAPSISFLTPNPSISSFVLVINACLSTSTTEPGTV